MAWIAPPTFTSGQVVSASDLNQYIRDNTNYLFSGRALSALVQTAAGATTTSTTFVDVSSANLTVSITVNSGRAICFWMADISISTGITVSFDWIVDSTTRSSGSGTGGNGLLQFTNANAVASSITLIGIFTGLSVGSHTFRPQWRVGSGTGTLAAVQSTMWAAEHW